mmetsp:Transcript_12692/g.17067  ORF Transcript_12692/g.17067 Transcript_12692/m.17067 type:complete len:212 (+) Transcript_12692:2383-3018(+)
MNEQQSLFTVLTVGIGLHKLQYLLFLCSSQSFGQSMDFLQYFKGNGLILVISLTNDVVIGTTRPPTSVLQSFYYLLIVLQILFDNFQQNLNLIHIFYSHSWTNSSRVVSVLFLKIVIRLESQRALIKILCHFGGLSPIKSIALLILILIILKFLFNRSTSNNSKMEIKLSCHRNLFFLRFRPKIFASLKSIFCVLIQPLCHPDLLLPSIKK